MNNEWLVELTESTVDEVNRILCLSASEFVKEFAVESDRVPAAKIEKAQGMIGTLRFFIKKAQGKNVHSVKVAENKAVENTSEQIFPPTNE